MSSVHPVLPKLALQLSNIFFAWLAWTPQKAPSSSEQHTFTKKPQSRDYLPNFISWYTPSFNVSMLFVTTYSKVAYLLSLYVGLAETRAFARAISPPLRCIPEHD